MKGFRNTTKIRSGFSFPAKAGFTSSTGKVQNISYTRKTPHRKPVMKAEGGQVSRRVESRGPMKALSEELRKTMMPKRDPMATRDRMIEDATGAAVTPSERARFASGGRVNDSALTGRSEPDSALNQESGGKTPLRPGFTRGGMAAKYAKGGRIPDHKVKAMIDRKMSKHVATPAPKGHKGLKSC